MVANIHKFGKNTAESRDFRGKSELILGLTAEYSKNYGNINLDSGKNVWMP